MRRLIRIFLFVVLFFGPIAIFLTAALAEEYPELKTEEPIYQSIIPGIYGFGGLYRRVSLPKPQTAEEARLQAEIQRIKAETEQYKKLLDQELKDRAHGVLWMRIGVALFVLGGMAFVVLKNYHLELIGVFAASSGLCAICYGAIVIKVAEHSTAIAVAFIASVIIAVAAYFCHGKGIGIRETAARLKRKS